MDELEIEAFEAKLEFDDAATKAVAAIRKFRISSQKMLAAIPIGCELPPNIISLLPDAWELGLQSPKEFAELVLEENKIIFSSIREQLRHQRGAR